MEHEEKEEALIGLGIEDAQEIYPELNILELTKDGEYMEEMINEEATLVSTQDNIIIEIYK